MDFRRFCTFRVDVHISDLISTRAVRDNRIPRDGQNDRVDDRRLRRRYILLFSQKQSWRISRTFEPGELQGSSSGNYEKGF